MGHFHELIAWQRAHRLTVRTYEITVRFPSHERFGLTTQMRRAAFSVASNIAEGYAKKGPKEFRRFLDIALGSLAELNYCFILARELRYLDQDAWLEVETLREEAGRVVWGLYRSMIRAKAS